MGKIQVQLLSCSCSIKRWLLPEINTHTAVFEEGASAQSNCFLPGKNSYSGTFWHPNIYAEHISTVMAFYLFGFTVRIIWMFTGYVQLLCHRHFFFYLLVGPLSLSLPPSLPHISSYVTECFVIFLAQVFAFAVTIEHFFAQHITPAAQCSTEWKHLNVSSICQHGWNTESVIQPRAERPLLY